MENPQTAAANQPDPLSPPESEEKRYRKQVNTHRWASPTDPPLVPEP